MRETRPSGSEGGAAQSNAPFLPLQALRAVEPASRMALRCKIACRHWGRAHAAPASRHARQKQALTPHPRAARPAWRRQASQRTKPSSRASPASGGKSGDTNPDMGVHRAQRLSPTAVYPSSRRATRLQQTEPCLRLLLGYTASRFRLTTLALFISDRANSSNTCSCSRTYRLSFGLDAVGGHLQTGSSRMCLG